MKLSHLIPSAAIALMAMASCADSGRWSVSGNITDAPGALLTLERSYNGVWNVVDSARLDDKGKFKFAQDPAGYPDIYRLTVDGRSVYFPIDSIDHITIQASAPTMATDATVSGSESADMMMQVNSLINEKVAAVGMKALNDSVLKRSLSDLVLADQNGIIAYYIVNKEISGQPFFNLNDRADLRVVGAVANAFTARRPNDPRTRYIQSRYLAARRAISAPTAPTQTLQATEVGFPEIELNDINGHPVKLSSVAGKGRPVVLNFTAYGLETSPAINLALANAYKAGGVEIYQISFDGDEFMWREAARNIPWVAVHNSPKDGDRVLRNYNVGGLPVTFIINSQGQLVERVANLADLPGLLAKYK